MTSPTGATSPATTGSLALSYHRQTEHSLARYAKGPEVLDWDMQPTRFRRYLGTRSIQLPHVADAMARDAVMRTVLTRARDSSAVGGPRAELSLPSIGVMLELAFGVTAWKRLGPDRWPVRANPSSGNLHPVEVYIAATGVPDLEDGIYHYQPEDHTLEWRVEWHAVGTHASSALPRPTGLCVAITTIPWREAWKYGERAFRYCQLDTGHAVASLSVAAACLHWRVQERRDVSWASLQQTLGLDRSSDFARSRKPATEHEEAELVCNLDVDDSRDFCLALPPHDVRQEFVGRATPIDLRPLYSWPVITEVIEATRNAGMQPSPELDSNSPQRLLASTHSESPSGPLPVHTLVTRRRSAQHFDAQYELSWPGLVRVLDSVLPAGAFGNALDDGSALELVLWVHRVAALAPGVYTVGRYTSAGPVERALTQRYGSDAVFTDSFRLSLIAPAQGKSLASQARILHCHQDIAASSCVTLGMFTDLDMLQAGPGYDYRRLLRAAGRMAHNLYLAAEREDLRGTGIGCFFDREVAEFLGLTQTPLRSLYHFCFGKPIDDPRIETTDPYPKEPN